MLTKMNAYLRLIRFDRPIGTMLLLWPTLWALWIAGEGSPDANTVMLFMLGVFVMRSAGCVINDYADRNIDGKVARTKDRPLAAGDLTEQNALITFACLLFIALVIVLQFNLYTIFISIFGVIIATIYPFAKRVTHLPQFVLGVAFSCGILMAFTALNNELGLNAWLIFLANFCWNVAYDTQLALSDREEDLKIGVKSTAILFGKYDRVIIFGFQLLFLITLVMVGILNELSWHYYSGLVFALVFILYQQYLIKDRQREQCFQSFLNNNWLGGMVFTGILLSTL